jgi:uncharacterized repeat protein (TIGR01451 family)
MSKTNINNFNENRARISATATILLLSLLLLLSMPLLMFPKIVVATDGSDEEDPVHIYYGGSKISSPPGPSFDVCLGESLTITVLVKWDIVPAESSVDYVVVQMVENTNFGITFNPQTSFTLYNPSPNSINVVVNVPAFWTTGIRQVNIYADVIAQYPPKGKGIPNVAGTDGYFQVNVISCVKQADLSIEKVGSTTQAHAGDTITYTYYVYNEGPDSACNVVVSDDLVTPTFVEGDANNNGCIDQGETWTYTATYTVQAGDPDPLVNTATVSSSDVNDPVPSNNVATWSVDLIAMICGYKFYDANANGIWDAGEPPVAGFKIELYDENNNLIATKFTDSDGKYCFDGLDAGTYTVEEVLPSGSWIPTTPTSITVTLQSGEIKENKNFGNLCLEPGHGGKTIGFWANAGNSLIDNSDRGYLNTLNLFKPNGWNYPPFSNNQQIKNYLLKADAKNMWWMLSAQLIATILNVRHGFLDGSTLVCIDPPTCSTFMSINDIINGAIGALGSNVPRATQEYWKNLLDKLNNNMLPFVSSESCSVEYPEEEVGSLAFPILPASYLLILLSILTAASIYYRQLLMEYYVDFITKIRRTLISCINLLVHQS